MATIESQIRTINRQLAEYYKRLGGESEEYEDLTTRLYDLLGEPKYNKKGNPFYSRGKSYGAEELDIAYGLVTGENTASRIEQQYIKDLVDMQGIESVTAENVKRYAKVKNKAFRYYSDLYTYLKETYEEVNGSGSWDDSDLRAEYYKRGAATDLPEDTAFWLDDEITDLIGGGFLSGIDRALQEIDAYQDQKKKRAADKAKSTRNSGRKKASEFGSDMF